MQKPHLPTKRRSTQAWPRAWQLPQRGWGQGAKTRRPWPRRRRWSPSAWRPTRREWPTSWAWAGQTARRGRWGRRRRRGRSSGSLGLGRSGGGGGRSSKGAGGSSVLDTLGHGRSSVGLDGGHLLVDADLLSGGRSGLGGARGGHGLVDGAAGAAASSV